MREGRSSICLDPLNPYLSLVAAIGSTLTRDLDCVPRMLALLHPGEVINTRSQPRLCPLVGCRQGKR